MVEAQSGFCLGNLSVLSYAQGFTLWHYRTGGSMAEVAKLGFFSDAGDLLASGDMVMLSAADGGAVMILVNTDGQVAAKPLRAALCHMGGS